MKIKKVTKATLRIIGVRRESGAKAPVQQRTSISVCSNIESEFQDVPVLYQVLFSFNPQFPGLSGFGKGTKLHKVIEMDCLRGNETPFKIRVNNARCSRSFIASVN